MTPRDAMLAALVATLWGLNFLAIDVGLRDCPPLLLAALRFAVVPLPGLLGLVPRPAAPWRVIVLVGLTMSLGQFGLLYASMAAGLSPGLAALVLQAQVLFTVVIAALALRERPSTRQSVGVLIGTLGLIVVGFGRGGAAPLVAFLLCLAAAFSWATGNVIARRAQVAGGLSLTVWSALVVPTPLFALSLLLDGPSTVLHALSTLGWPTIGSTLYTVVLASWVGYGIFNSLLSRWPSAAVVPWVLLAPVVAMLASWLLLDTVPTPGTLIGGVILLAGALIALTPSRAKTSPEPA